jgi:hypothetical protein
MLVLFWLNLEMSLGSRRSGQDGDMDPDVCVCVCVCLCVVGEVREKQRHGALITGAWAEHPTLRNPMLS